MDFSTVDAFGVGLETGLTLVLVSLNDAGGAVVLKEPVDSNRSFPVIRLSISFWLHQKLCDTC